MSKIEIAVLCTLSFAAGEMITMKRANRKIQSALDANRMKQETLRLAANAMQDCIDGLLDDRRDNSEVIENYNMYVRFTNILSTSL
jgi:hypothetical protein